MENVLILGGSVEKTSVCLAIYGEDLNPDEISKILSCQSKGFETYQHRFETLRHLLYVRECIDEILCGTLMKNPAYS